MGSGSETDPGRSRYTDAPSLVTPATQDREKQLARTPSLITKQHTQMLHGEKITPSSQNKRIYFSQLFCHLNLTKKAIYKTRT